MVYKIFTNRVVPSRGEGDLKFGPHAVDGTNQYRLLHFRELEAASERADVQLERPL